MSSKRQLDPQRDFLADRINNVVNHPEVRPYVLAQNDEPIDLSELLANPANVALMCDFGGLLFINLGSGAYEVHTQFLPNARGAFALVVTQNALRWMFTRTDALELWTKVPARNLGALGLVRAIHGQKEFTSAECLGEKDVASYSLNYMRWSQHAPSVKALGEWFHQKLEAKFAANAIVEEVHPDDESHDRAVGATIETIRGGQIDKALALYNRWAQIAGYAPIRPVTGWPLVLDIQTALVVMNDDLSDFEVIKKGGV